MRTEPRADAPPTGPARPIELPADLRHRLGRFRTLVWRVKLLEAACGAAGGILLGFLVVFVADRFGETPQWVRWTALGLAAAACAWLPLAVHRWVWRQRTFEQLARLVARRFPGIGDQLLGIIDIVRDDAGDSARGRSRALCAAAVEQVAAESRRYDLAAAVPPARRGAWAIVAAGLAAAALAAAWWLPEAAANAWLRFAAPWRSIARYTVARLEPLPAEIVVPHGEAAEVPVRLAADTRARPAVAAVRIASRPAAAAALVDGGYAVAVPPQLAAVPLDVAVGDARARSRLVPMVRPEITGLVAEVRLPDYLERPLPERQDVRGGTLAPVRESTIALEVTASRPLAAASVAGAAVPTTAAAFRVADIPAATETTLECTWRDAHGLAGARPLVVRIMPRDDAAPAVTAIGLPAPRSILLASDTLKFRVAATDDFGLKRVGLEWQGESAGTGTAPETGTRLLKAGGPEAQAIEAAATFCPDALGVRPGAIVLRPFAEDYLPGRGRVPGPPLVIYVVDKAEHALVMNERLARWRQQASEVRDREQALLAANTELRQLPAEELLADTTRRRIEQQAAAERAQARRMERLVAEGSELVREAIKNPEFEPATLERLAADIQTLAEIGTERMPSVAELLAAAAAAKTAAAAPAGAKPATPQAGKPAAGSEGQPSPGDLAAAPPETAPAAETEPGDAAEDPVRVGPDRSPAGAATPPPPPPTGLQTPQVVDRESSQQPPAAAAAAAPPPGGQGRLGLPTVEAGVRPPSAPEPPRPADEPAAEEALASAVEAQQKLLAEFAKVADDLAAVMASLEGSTFVKRLKLASREQGSIAGRIAGMSAEAFAAPESRPEPIEQAVGEVAQVNAKQAEQVSNLMDDLQAYLDRRQVPAFRTVLEEMQELDALGSLRQLSEDVRREAGMSIAQAEFWSDTFDRLADDLVEPAEGGGSGESQPGDGQSVPPEVVLEAMQILAGEVDLREETRVAEQAREGTAEAERAAAVTRLGAAQDALADRVAGLVDRLLEEDDGEQAFGREIELFEQVAEVMGDAAGILRTPDTGPRAIGAESEAIELLLQSQAAGGGAGGGGGGGGGSSPGGGGTGSTRSSALALVGSGNLARGAGQGGEREQSTGAAGRVLPEEFRAGLDAYFNRFEKARP
jgi:hypothetical protein